MPGGYVCSGSMKGEPGRRRASRGGERAVRKLFTKAQRAFYAEHAPEGIALDDLTVLGPIFVLKLKFAPQDFGRQARRRDVAVPRRLADPRALDEVRARRGVRRRRGDACVPRRPGCRPRRRAADEDADGAEFFSKELKKSA